MLIVLSLLGSTFGLEVDISIYAMLAGYILFLLALTYAGYKSGGGGGCCFTGFLAIFPLMPILMLAPYPLGMDKNHSSSTFAQFGSLGIGLLFFVIIYVFLGIIVGIIRSKSGEQSTVDRTSASYERPVVNDPFKSGDERVIEREEPVVRRIPPQCFRCGADINPEEVDWIGPDTVRCPHCRASLVVEFE